MGAEMQRKRLPLWPQGWFFHGQYVKKSLRYMNPA